MKKLLTSLLITLSLSVQAKINTIDVIASYEQESTICRAYGSELKYKSDKTLQCVLRFQNGAKLQSSFYIQKGESKTKYRVSIRTEGEVPKDYIVQAHYDFMAFFYKDPDDSIQKMSEYLGSQPLGKVSMKEHDWKPFKYTLTTKKEMLIYQMYSTEITLER